jgi:hypothetical protein
MRLRRITMACGAATVLAANALLACGGSSAGLAPVPDEGGSDGSSPGQPQDSAAPSNDGGDASTPADGTALDGAEAAPADALSPTEGGAGEASMDASSGAASDAAVCNPVVNGAPSIGVTVNAGTPPASTGGQVLSGTYYLTALTSYGGNALCGAATAQGTAIVIAESLTSGTLDGVTSFTLFGNQQTRTTQDTYTTSGTATMSLAAACPPDDAGATQVQFTATATQVIVTQASPVAACGTLGEEFTRQ